jgi:hypothetical protein
LPLIHPKMTQIFQTYTLLAYRHPEEIAVLHGVSGVYLTQVHALGRTSRICVTFSITNAPQDVDLTSCDCHIHAASKIVTILTALVVSVSVALVFSKSRVLHSRRHKRRRTSPLLTSTSPTSNRNPGSYTHLTW